MLHNKASCLDGKTGVIDAIGYISTKENEKRSTLIRLGKAFLHKSLQNFEEQVFIMITEKFGIRIDKMTDGYPFHLFIKGYWGI